MKYCPKCKSNFKVQQGFCPACHTTLIELYNGKQGAAKPDNSWVIVGGVKDDLNFEIAKGTLDSNNIPSVILNSVDSVEIPNVSDSTFDNDDSNIIMVPREFKFEAIMILEDILGENLKKINNNINF